MDVEALSELEAEEFLRKFLANTLKAKEESIKRILARAPPLLTGVWLQDASLQAFVELLEDNPYYGARLYRLIHPEPPYNRFTSWLRKLPSGHSIEKFIHAEFKSFGAFAEKKAPTIRLRGNGKNGGKHARGGLHHGHSSIQESFIKSDSPYYGFQLPNSSNASEHPHFSLREEARNTGKQQSYWSSDSRLRHSRVNFVSAETAKTAGEDVPIESRVNDSTSHRERSNGRSQSPTVAEASQIAFAKMHLQSDGVAEDEIPQLSRSIVSHTTRPAETGTSTAFFTIDTIGSSSNIKTGLEPPVIRSRSLSSSSSEEDVVVFQGRSKKTTNEVNGINHDRTRLQDTPRATGTTILDNVDNFATIPLRAAASKSKQVFSKRPDWDDTAVNWSHGSGRRDPAKVKGAGKVPKGWQSPRNRRKGHDKYEEEIMADYIENMRDHGDLAQPNSGVYPPRDLSLGDGNDWEDMTKSRQKDTRTRKDGWASDELGDFDDISTDNEILGEIEAILKKRHRSSGLQYLVVFEGSSTDEARWTLESAVTSDFARKIIHAFEEDDAELMRLAAQEGDTLEEDSDEAEESDDSDDDPEEAFRDEEDLIRRRMARMTDEKVARLLAKQEELGLGSAELMLFDADEMSNEDEEEGSSVRNTHRQHIRSNPRRRPRGDFPNASLLANVLEQDAYNGFDVMDFERPSLKRKNKGRRASLPFELSDSEVEASLRSAWTADREKKRMRKQEREELRAQGLLGKKNKFKGDTKAKYSEGMSMTQIRDELKLFLTSTYESHALPPMDKRDRALIHQFANAFQLKSKSVGKGKSRFPVLYKTSRTSDFDDNIFAKIASRLERRFFPRMDKRGKGAGAAANRRGGGGANGAAVTYRDGEIVGAAAPELGSENKGRAMLEKMGWQAGTALGAMDNKGILQPIEHVVKVSKYGLG